MSYVREFIYWCKIWKDAVWSTLLGFGWYFVGIVIFEVNPLFMLIPFFLFVLTQYFHYLWKTEYVDKYYELTKDELDTAKMLEKILTIIPTLLSFSGTMFYIILATLHFS